MSLALQGIRGTDVERGDGMTCSPKSASPSQYSALGALPRAVTTPPETFALTSAFAPIVRLSWQRISLSASINF